MANYRNGSVIQLKNGKFRAFFTHNGKRISKISGNKQSALDWLAVQRSDVALGAWVEPTDITVGQWVIEYLRYCSSRLKANTLYSYKNLAKKLLPLAKIKLQSLNVIQIQQVIDAIDSPSYRTDVYRFLHSVIARAVKLNLLRNNIMMQVEPPKYQPKRKDVFSKAEIARIYKVLESNKYRAFFVLAFATGCRIGELQALKINNVKEDFVRIDSSFSHATRKDDTTKTASSERDITLPRHIIDTIRREWESRGAVLNSYVFCTRNHNTPITRKTIQDAWKKILLKANVPYRNFHYIRHTHATQLLSSGIPILEVQHRLGHANASTTLNRYGHTLIDNKDKVLNAVDNLLCNMVI